MSQLSVDVWVAPTRHKGAQISNKQLHASSDTTHISCVLIFDWYNGAPSKQIDCLNKEWMQQSSSPTLYSVRPMKYYSSDTGKELRSTIRRSHFGHETQEKRRRWPAVEACCVYNFLRKKIHFRRCETINMCYFSLRMYSFDANMSFQLYIFCVPGRICIAQMKTRALSRERRSPTRQLITPILPRYPIWRVSMVIQITPKI